MNFVINMNKILALSILMCICYSMCAQPDGLELIVVIQDEVGNMLPMSTHATGDLYKKKDEKIIEKVESSAEHQLSKYHISKQQEDNFDCLHIIYDVIRLSVYEYAYYFLGFGCLAK